MNKCGLTEENAIKKTKQNKTSPNIPFLEAHCDIF